MKSLTKKQLQLQIDAMRERELWHQQALWGYEQNDWHEVAAITVPGDPPYTFAIAVARLWTANGGVVRVTQHTPGRLQPWAYYQGVEAFCRVNAQNGSTEASRALAYLAGRLEAYCEQQHGRTLS